jgi:hypothetical protein
MFELMLKNHLHIFNFILLPLVIIISLLIRSTLDNYLNCSIALVVNFILLVPFEQIRWRTILWLNLGLIVPLISYALSCYWFGVIQPGLFATKLHLALELTLRLYLLSITSSLFILHLDQYKLVNNLIQYRLLSVRFGFALLAVFNSWGVLIDEFKRIQLAYQMRYRKRYFSVQIIFPLLVNATRYAHNLSLSLHNRGLTEQRSFYIKRQKFTKIDYLIYLVNISIVIYSIY